MEKRHGIDVYLSGEDWKNLKEKSKQYNISVSTLLKSFIVDLVESDSSNGSDERRLANEWYDRNYFNFKEYD